MVSRKFLVMRYGPRPLVPNGRRHVSVVCYQDTLLNARYFAIGWLSVDRQHGERSLLWVVRAGKPATRVRPRATLKLVVGKGISSS